MLRIENTNGEAIAMKRVGLFFLALTLTSPVLAQDGRFLLDGKTRDLFHEALSGELAKEHVIEITRHNRVQASQGYRAAAQYVLQKLQSYGFSEKDAYIESFKSDGKIEYQTWQSPSGWDISWAELRMLQPYEERIVGYPEIAMSVVTYSNPGDVTAELVWVGSGERDEEYAGKDVKDKLVLATGYGGEVHRKAVLQRGAKAVVCFLDDNRAKEHPDMLQYTGMWPRPNELQRTTFGFNLTNRQGMKLRDLLERGEKVVLRGVVKGKGLEPFFMDVVVAHIRGAERADEELVFSAHLDHPKESANDNASGSAAILDIARALKDLIDSGRLPKPKRSFRFMWVPEWNGTMAYIDAHPEMCGPELGGKFLADMNLDMVGENLELLHSKLVITRTPWSVPSIVNDVVENLAEMVDGMNIRTLRGSQSAFNYHIADYGSGSDHMMFIDRKIPAAMFTHYPDYTHHTSEDTPDKVDPVQLERCEMIAAGRLWFLANLSESEALNLAHLSHANALKRLGLAAYDALQMLTDVSEEQLGQQWFEGVNTIEHATITETKALQSILQFNNSRAIESVLDGMISQLDQTRLYHLKALRSAVAARGGDTTAVPTRPQTDTRIPVRLTRGPLDFGLPGSKLPPEDAEFYRTRQLGMSFDAVFEAVNLINGKRTVSEIRDAVSAEFGPVKLESVARYLNDLVKVGVIGWNKSPRP